MEPIITVNQYPIGWEWLDRVPLEDFNWLIEIFSIMTDNTDTYDFVGYTDSETLPGHQKICSVDKIPLANFLNEDQGYKSGISMYGHYIACKCLDISSEREYMNQYTDIRILTMKKKDIIYIPHQDTWTEHFPNPGSNKNDYTLYLSDPQAQYNKLLRTQQKLRNKKK